MAPGREEFLACAVSERVTQAHHSLVRRHHCTSTRGGIHTHTSHTALRTHRTRTRGHRSHRHGRRATTCTSHDAESTPTLPHRPSATQEYSMAPRSVEPLSLSLSLVACSGAHTLPPPPTACCHARAYMHARVLAAAPSLLMPPLAPLHACGRTRGALPPTSPPLSLLSPCVHGVHMAHCTWAPPLPPHLLSSRRRVRARARAMHGRPQVPRPRRTKPPCPPPWPKLAPPGLLGGGLGPRRGLNLPRRAS